MKTIKFLAIVCLALGFTAGAINAQTVSTKEVDIPWSVFIPCSGVAGELAEGTLTLHTIMHTNKDGVVTKFHSQPQGGELIGLETGIVFHPTGVSQEMMKAYSENGAIVNTYINIYHMVGQGGIQLKIKMVYHVTINANGDLTAEVDKNDVVCK
jgi:hypothetical protein